MLITIPKWNNNCNLKSKRYKSQEITTDLLTLASHTFVDLQFIRGKSTQLFRQKTISSEKTNFNMAKSILLFKPASYL